MRVPVLALLLLIAGFVGCLADEGPEQPIDPSSEEPEEDEDPDRPAEDEDDASEDEEDGRAGEGNGSARDGEEDDGEAANASIDPEPFELEGSLEVGYLAAVGTTWIGGPEDAGAEAEDHCPRAELHVPAGSQRLTVSVDGDPVGSPSNATSSGLGAYTIYIEGPEGESAALDWASTPIDGPEALNWTIADPANGTWNLEARPEGPVVQQTWRIDARVVGQAFGPPDQLAFATTC